MFSISGIQYPNGVPNLMSAVFGRPSSVNSVTCGQRCKNEKIYLSNNLCQQSMSNCLSLLRATPYSTLTQLVGDLRHVSPGQIKRAFLFPSFVSSPSFFENVYGFPRESSGMQLNFLRQFKTRRSSGNTGIGGSLSNKTAERLIKLEGFSNVETSLLKELFKGTELSPIEMSKAKGIVMGYTAGFSAGSEEAHKKGTPKSSFNIFGRKDKKSLKVGPMNFWDVVNKLASLLIIVAIMISLSQVFNVSFFRLNQRGNEIMAEDIEITFDDVKGCDEAKQELQEIVEFLINPEKFSRLGGKLPKGCLLVGPPGTGKTLLARAVAGQAGVPFFHASGSEFDEVLVGQGARRVRDLFLAAKSRAPCVIFIDEIDSVGAKRTSSVLHPYANQTINQLLAEMDGFLSNEGVIVLGATNRSEDLDKALLRPGRFDTRVMVPIPDMKGRRDILNLYLSKIQHDASVNVEKLSKMTVGFTGADLENMVNTSAIRAAIQGMDWVTMSEFEYSHDKHVLGIDWKSRVRDETDLRITAYHEAGHTLVAFFTEHSQPLHKVTIVAKGLSGGHTALLPEKDSYHETQAQLLASMDVNMGGRAAEEVVFGLDMVTGGASSDLMSATRVAEAMVKKLGMSKKLGLRVVDEGNRAGFGGGSGPDVSQSTTDIIDSEVTRLLNDAYDRAKTILQKQRSELNALAEALLKYETLDADDVKSIINGDPQWNNRKMISLPAQISSSHSPVLGYGGDTGTKKVPSGRPTSCSGGRSDKPSQHSSFH